MATYNIYGIGAALVKTEVEVSDDSDGQLYINDLQDAGVDFHRAGQESLLLETT
jgi:hypothetical protein